MAVSVIAIQFPVSRAIVETKNDPPGTSPVVSLTTQDLAAITAIVETAKARK